MSTFESPNDYRNYLVHHGIKGQKWGVRNGPPYPLDSQSNKGIVTFAVMKLAEAAIDSASDSVKKKQMKKIMEERNAKDYKIDKKTGLRLKNSEASIEEDLVACNPLFSKIGVGKSANNNCGYCSFAYELRRRGYDTIAKLSKTGINGPSEMAKIFPTVKPLIFDPHHIITDEDGNYNPNNKRTALNRMAANWDPTNTTKITKAFSELENQNNSRGILMIQWRSSGGHACSYFVEGGEIHIADAQSGKILKFNRKYLSRAATIMAYRTDDVKDKDINFEEIKRFVQ